MKQFVKDGCGCSIKCSTLFSAGEYMTMRRPYKGGEGLVCNGRGRSDASEFSLLQGGFLYYECSAGVYSTLMQWISVAITLPKLAQRVLELVIHFCTECVDSAILLPLTIINTNITMVISKNQLLLRDTQKHCNF